MRKIKDSLHYMKSPGGACINQDDVGYEARLRRKQVNDDKTIRINNMQRQIIELQNFIKGLQ